MTATADRDTDLASEFDIDETGAPELIPMDSLTAEHTGRWTFLILDGAAFMMQAMHPVIGEVTGKYSAAFQGDPAGRAIRSVDSVLRWIYGGTEAVAEGNRVRDLHKPLKMKSERTGKQISALNPEAYQWVIATGYIVNSQSGRLLIGRDFTDAEKEELLRDNLRLARLLHVPLQGYPRTHAEFEEYFEKMVPTLEGNAQALSLIHDLKTGQVDLPPAIPAPLRPAVRRAMRPFMRFNYLSVVGLLDPRLRDKLGVSWSARDERELTRAYALVRTAYRVLPDRLTYFPLAYHARKHHECLEKMTQRQQKSFAYHLPENAGA